MAQLAPAMRAYQAVRAEGEAILTESGLKATFLRAGVRIVTVPDIRRATA